MQNSLEKDSSSDLNPIRLAVLCDATPERNGVGSYYADLVEQLKTYIESAELICPEETKTVYPRYLTPPLPGDSTQRVWWPRPLRVWRKMVSVKPHVIIVPTPGPFGLFGLLAASRFGVPLIIGFHTHYEALADIYWDNAFGRLCQWYLESCNRLLFRHSELVLANSPDMSKLASKLGAKNVELMGTPIPLEFFHIPTSPVHEHANKVLFVGRLAEEKNISDVIDIARVRPNLIVTIAGDGPMRDVVVKSAGNLPNLNYLGWVSRRDLISILDENDILLLPSKVESFGTVALEGMARARSVIVSGSCGIIEWPNFQNCIFRIADDETAIQAVDRVCQLPLNVRQEKALLSHKEAWNLNHWTLSNWIEQINKSLVNED